MEGFFRIDSLSYDCPWKYSFSLIRLFKDLKSAESSVRFDERGVGVNFNPRLSKAICDGVSTWSEQLIIFVSFAGLVEASSSEKLDHPCCHPQQWPQKWRFLALHLGVGTAHLFLHLNEPLRGWAEAEDFDFFVLDFASDRVQLYDWKDQNDVAAVAAAEALVAAAAAAVAAALVAAAVFVVALYFAAPVAFAVCFLWN